MNNDTTNQMNNLSLKNEQLKEQLNNMQVKLDSLESELEKEKTLKIDSIIEAKVMDRISLISKAIPFLGEAEGLYKKTDREIMEAVINSFRSDNIELRERSDDYVKRLFEASIAVVPRLHMDAKGDVAKVMMRNRNNDDNDSLNMKQAIAHGLLLWP